MECNKDEAIRAKTIAEKKLAEKDFTVAKKFTLKAQTLYPELENIPQMLTTLDVYISAEKNTNGEPDWYHILGVNPSDDIETIKKHYRKLVLMLHPDKNKSVGADGAFKILLEAWSLLSDKDKRLAYNLRRDSQRSQNNGACFVSNTTSKQKIWVGPASASIRSHQSEPARASTKVRAGARADTFWTICRRCKMHYEYMKGYVNHTLICPKCQKPFLATETAAPTVNFPKSAQPYMHRWHQGLSHHVASSRLDGYVGPSSSKRVREEFYAAWMPSKRR